MSKTGFDERRQGCGTSESDCDATLMLCVWRQTCSRIPTPCMPCWSTRAWRSVIELPAGAHAAQDAGHYTSYVRDPSAAGAWLSCNDERVRYVALFVSLCVCARTAILQL